MTDGRVLHAALHLLDRQMRDRHGTLCGKVDDLELSLVGGVGSNQFSTHQPKYPRLPAPGFTEHDQVRLFCEIDVNGLQFVLADTDQDV